jgi:hypothetical protein
MSGHREKLGLLLLSFCLDVAFNSAVLPQGITPERRKEGKRRKEHYGEPQEMRKSGLHVRSTRKRQVLQPSLRGNREEDGNRLPLRPPGMRRQRERRLNFTGSVDQPPEKGPGFAPWAFLGKPQKTQARVAMRRRTIPAKPTRPLPRRRRLEGSGVSAASPP